MPLVAKNLNSFTIKNNQVVLDPAYLQQSKNYFKKITGTRFASVLGYNKYNSPFKTWMGMVNLYKDVMDPTLAKVGNTIEPMVRDYVEKKLGINFKVYNPMAIGWDVFKENQIFGGIPDGEPINANGIVDYTNDKPMLEVKTSSIDSFVYKKTNNELKMQFDFNGYPQIKEPNGKRNSWFNNNDIVIPMEYRMQLGLYLYLRNINHGVFAIAFLTPRDYKNPEGFNADNHELRIVDFTVKLEIVSQFVKQATDWYNKYIVTGISPEMTPEDQMWLDQEKSFAR
ncbi:MAG: YqaJ viral recombinase family protein [Mycoplasmataceae bacterium]|nr:YqaJ viral recombinase family protein [Mycoplasmataceae bacterium]